MRHGRPGVLLGYHGGIGDDVMLTVLCHELRRRGAGPVWLLSRNADLMEHHPDIAAVLPWKRSLHPALARRGWTVLDPRFSSYDRDADRVHLLAPDRHIITTMCRAVGIVGPITRVPRVYLLDAERRAGARLPRQVAIQSSGLVASTPMRNKQWPAERFQAVVSALRGEFDFVQLGSPEDPPLDGVALDLRGRTTRRESAAVLSQSLALVGNVGFLMHLARAVDCRSVVVYGGREHPDQTGYSCNENLYRAVPCAPCWQRNRCDFGRRCMAEVTVADVAAAARRAAAKYGTALEEDADVIEVPPFDGMGARGRPTATVDTPFGPRRVELALLA